jgi:hydroxylamine reductase (hybrid-cluster protein)
MLLHMNMHAAKVVDDTIKFVSNTSSISIEPELEKEKYEEIIKEAKSRKQNQWKKAAQLTCPITKEAFVILFCHQAYTAVVDVWTRCQVP